MSSTTLILTLAVLLTLYLLYGVCDGLRRRWQQYLQRQRLTLVVHRVKRQQDIVKIWLRHPAGTLLPRAKAGQHILLYGRDLQGQTVSRAYSLTQNCHHRHQYTLAIKAQPQGRLSQALFQSLAVGDVLHTSRPRGHFVLRPDWRHQLMRLRLGLFSQLLPAKPLVLVGAGIGLTPMLAMAIQAIQQRRPVMLCYQARTTADLLWHRHLQRLPGLDYRPILSQPDTDWPGARGRLTAALLIAQAGIDAHFYLCAPAEMVMSLEQDLRQAGVKHCNHELFSAAHSTQSFPVQLGRLQTDSLGHRSVLDALLAVKAQVPYDCRGGSCGQCRLKLISGHCHQVLAAEFEPDEGEILACCVQAASPLQLDYCQSRSFEVVSEPTQEQRQWASTKIS